MPPDGMRPANHIFHSGGQRDSYTGVNNESEWCIRHRWKQPSWEAQTDGGEWMPRRPSDYYVVLLFRALHISIVTTCALSERLRGCANCRARTYTSSGILRTWMEGIFFSFKMILLHMVALCNHLFRHQAAGFDVHDYRDNHP